MCNSEYGPLESSLGFFLSKSYQKIQFDYILLFYIRIGLPYFFLISNQIEDKKKKSETPQNLFLPMTIVMILHSRH